MTDSRDNAIHLAEVMPEVTRDRRTLWRGWCACGWVSPIACGNLRLVEIAVRLHLSTNSDEGRRAA